MLRRIERSSIRARDGEDFGTDSALRSLQGAHHEGGQRAAVRAAKEAMSAIFEITTMPSSTTSVMSGGGRGGGRIEGFGDDGAARGAGTVGGRLMGRETSRIHSRSHSLRGLQRVQRAIVTFAETWDAGRAFGGVFEFHAESEQRFGQTSPVETRATTLAKEEARTRENVSAGDG